MKKVSLSVTIMFILVVSGSAQNTFPSTGRVGIGTTSPHVSSLLEVRSTSRGVLFPRMTKAQRDAIGTPATGLLIYQTDNNPGFYYYLGSGWTKLITAAAGLTLANLAAPTAVNQHLLPNMTATKDLGSVTKKWRNLYLSGTLSAATISTTGKITAGNGGIFGYDSGGAGVYGSGSSWGVYGTSPSIGVYGASTSANYGVYGTSSYIGVGGNGTSYGVYATASTSSGWGVYGNGYIGVRGNGSYGLYGTGSSIGVYGTGPTYGVYGFSSSARGVYGQSTNGIGGYFYSTNSYGLWAETGRTGNYYAAVFNGNTYCYNSYLTSDKTLKQNVEEFDNALSIINKLKPRNYEFRRDEKYAALNLPTGKHYGLIAQELEEVLPNLVKEAPHPLTGPKPEAIEPVPDNGKMPSPAPLIKEEPTETINIKAVNYTELIPILVKAIQEQSAEIKALSEQVKQLTKDNGITSTNLDGAFLSQSVPNPTSFSAKINYNIPSSLGRAELVLTNSLGQKIRQIALAANGSGMVEINTAKLSVGTYYYTLFLNGKSAETRKMIVSR